MSKASEWVEKHAEAAEISAGRITGPVCELGGDGLARVINNGMLEMVAVRLTPEQARGLARWILDTFGEDEAEKGGKK